MYDLAKNFKKNAQFFRLEKRTKRVLVQKIFLEKPRILSRKSKKCQESCQEIQEMLRILPRNLGKPKNKQEKARWMIMYENA